MKTAVVLIASLAFVLGGVPKDRFDPCIFIDCSQHSVSTKAPTTKSPPPKSEDTGKFQIQLVYQTNLNFRPSVV